MSYSIKETNVSWATVSCSSRLGVVRVQAHFRITILRQNWTRVVNIITQRYFDIIDSRSHFDYHALMHSAPRSLMQNCIIMNILLSSVHPITEFINVGSVASEGNSAVTDQHN